MNPRDKALSGFKKRFGMQPEYLGRAPGRVNLMGEHVDYNDGCVLPVAIDRTVLIAFSPSGTDRSIIRAADLKSEIELASQGSGRSKGCCWPQITRLGVVSGRRSAEHPDG